jgi:hypothetical protein
MGKIFVPHPGPGWVGPEEGLGEDIGNSGDVARALLKLQLGRATITYG